MKAASGDRVRYRWVIGSGTVGLLLVALAFVAQYALTWEGAPIEALIAVGTAVMLAGVLYFLQRRFVVEVREVVTRTAESVAESVADTRVAERVQEVNARLTDLGNRMDQLLAERRQRQDEVVSGMDVPTFVTVATALAEANRLGAIVDGHVRVQSSYDPDELALDFSWGRDLGDSRFSQPARDALKVEAWVYEDEYAVGGRPVIETTWGPADAAEDVGMRLREQLERRGRLKSQGTLDWAMALRNLQRSVGLAIRSRRRDGTGWLRGALYELVTDELAITDLGIDAPAQGVVLSESEFPDRYADARQSPQEWDPPRPDWILPERWKSLLRRGRYHFPIRRGPYLGRPTWMPLSEPPR